MKLSGPIDALRLEYGSIGRSAAEVVLALATGLLLARFAWVASAPPALQPQSLAPLSSAPANQTALALLTETNPFREASLSNTQAAVPTSLDIQIAGLRWSEGNETTSSAVLILPDNSQKRIAVGEEIISGAILETVTADRVFLRYNGQLQELLLKDLDKPLFASPTEESVPPSPAPSQTSALLQEAAPNSTSPTPALLLTDVDMQPELRNGAISGYRLYPRGQGHFQSAGLEAGDLVLRVNGNTIEGMAPDAIQAAVMSSDLIALDVVRRGAIVRLRLSPESGLSQ